MHAALPLPVRQPSMAPPPDPLLDTRMANPELAAMIWVDWL